MKKINKYLIILLFLITIFSFSACSNIQEKNINPNLASSNNNKVPLKSINLDNLKELKLQISDMTCAGCSSGIEAIVSNLNGVEYAKVNFETGIGIVKYDPTIISIREIVNASNNLYPTKVFKN